MRANLRLEKSFMSALLQMSLLESVGKVAVLCPNCKAKKTTRRSVGDHLTGDNQIASIANDLQIGFSPSSYSDISYDILATSTHILYTDERPGLTIEEFSGGPSLPTLTLSPIICSQAIKQVFSSLNIESSPYLVVATVANDSQNIQLDDYKTSNINVHGFVVDTWIDTYPIIVAPTSKPILITLM